MSSEYPKDDRSLEQESLEDLHFYVDFVNPPEGMEHNGIEVDGVRYSPTDTWIVPNKDTVKIKYLWKEVSASVDDHIHNYIDKVIPPTCTEKGYTEHKCEGCSDTYNDSYVDALGHKDADKDGKCDVCNKDMISQQREDNYYCTRWIFLLILIVIALIIIMVIRKKKELKRINNTAAHSPDGWVDRPILVFAMKNRH